MCQWADKASLPTAQARLHCSLCRALPCPSPWPPGGGQSQRDLTRLLLPALSFGEGAECRTMPTPLLPAPAEVKSRATWLHASNCCSCPSRPALIHEVWIFPLSFPMTPQGPQCQDIPSETQVSGSSYKRAYLNTAATVWLLQV